MEQNMELHHLFLCFLSFPVTYPVLLSYKYMELSYSECFILNTSLVTDSASLQSVIFKIVGKGKREGCFKLLVEQQGWFLLTRPILIKYLCNCLPLKWVFCFNLTVSKKHGKLITFLRTFMKSRPTKQKLKQRGILKERVFGCDLGEHLLNSGHDGKKKQDMVCLKEPPQHHFWKKLGFNYNEFYMSIRIFYLQYFNLHLDIY